MRLFSTIKASWRGSAPVGTSVSANHCCHAREEGDSPGGIEEGKSGCCLFSGDQNGLHRPGSG
ncbi:hypothetical protein CsSME_00036699 [Camellia sinensis var. sinensis]